MQIRMSIVVTMTLAVKVTAIPVDLTIPFCSSITSGKDDNVKKWCFNVVWYGAGFLYVSYRPGESLPGPLGLHR